jgi:hypothetical protein
MRDPLIVLGRLVKKGDLQKRVFDLPRNNHVNPKIHKHEGVFQKSID